MVATSFVVMTLLAQCFLRVDVATMVSRRNLFVFPFYCFLSHDLSFRLRPPFSGCDLVCGLLPSQVSNLSCDLKVMSRLLLMFIPFFWPQPQFFVATSFLLLTSIPGRDHKVMSRPHVAFFWLHVVPIDQK